MSPRKALTQADIALRPGQLTTRGFMQHIELGQLLNKLYGRKYLANVLSSHMYVRTTNYARTVQVMLIYRLYFENIGNNGSVILL